MKSIIKALLLGGAGSIAIASAALAADLSRPLPPPSAPVWNWTGFYAGLNGGYGWVTDPVLFTGPTQLGIRDNPSGSLFGVQLGYNWQWTPEWVFGVETDIDWAGIFGSANAPAFGIIGTDIFSYVAEQRVEALGTLRGRVGYALDNVLLYGTGGLAYGRTTLDTGVSDVLAGRTCGPAGFCAVASSTQWMTGWAVGIGFDWAFLPRWSFRSEYLHYDLGTVHQTLVDSAVPALAVSSSATFRGDIFRGAINFKLN
jgi:outer membrane immunogenic protein